MEAPTIRQREALAARVRAVAMGLAQGGALARGRVPAELLVDSGDREADAAAVVGWLTNLAEQGEKAGGRTARRLLAACYPRLFGAGSVQGFGLSTGAVAALTFAVWPAASSRVAFERFLYVETLADGRPQPLHYTPLTKSCCSLLRVAACTESKTTYDLLMAALFSEWSVISRNAAKLLCPWAGGQLEELMGISLIRNALRGLPEQADANVIERLRASRSVVVARALDVLAEAYPDSRLLREGPIQRAARTARFMARVSAGRGDMLSS